MVKLFSSPMFQSLKNRKSTRLKLLSIALQQRLRASRALQIQSKRHLSWQAVSLFSTSLMPRAMRKNAHIASTLLVMIATSRLKNLNHVHSPLTHLLVLALIVLVSARSSRWNTRWMWCAIVCPRPWCLRRFLIQPEKPPRSRVHSPTAATINRSNA